MAVSEKSKANLQPWPKGVSGNPSGKPRRRPISDWYAAVADRPLPDDLRKKLKLKKGTTFAQAVAVAQFVKAIEGEARNASEIREAIEGKATQRIELSGVEDGPPVEIVDRLDLGKLTKDELLRYREILKKASRRDAGRH